MMKKIATLWYLLLAFAAFTQNLDLTWKFQTNGKVLASPLIENETVYVGNEKGIFFALDLNSGKEKWRLETGGSIQAKATWVNGNIFFESANIFYLVNAQSGKELWNFDPKMVPFIFKYQDHEWHYKIDPFDDKRSEGFLYEGIIYIGCGNGKLYGLNAKSGKVEVEFEADDASPIRSSPLVDGDRLYFGDWNGVVYAYSITSKELIWKKKTYRDEKPYGTFGGVVSQFLSYKGLLFFGARNYTMNTLDATTGGKEWTYIDPQRGWIIGDPVVYNDTLYIGGSDNFTMYAFNPDLGQVLWSHNCKRNIITKPIVTDQYVIYTVGNWYNTSEKGALYVLNRMTGDEITKFNTPKGAFSSPAQINDYIVFGCLDQYLYCVKLE